MIFHRFGIKSRNIILLYSTTLLQGMMFFLPILALYYQESLFSVKNVALIFSIEALFSVIFEVPTGAIADLFGRKRTLILATVINILGIAVLSIGGNMAMFVVYAVLVSLARSLNSGTDTALMYDTLKNEGKENFYKKMSGMYMSIWPIGATIGSIVGGYLATISLHTPIFYTLIPVVISLVLNFFLVEPEYEKKTGTTLNGHIWESIKDVLKNKQMLIILSGGVIAWSLGESVHFLSQIFFQSKQIPILWYGYLGAASFSFSSLGFYCSHTISERFGNKKTVVLSIVFLSLLLIAST